jgi:hypothetical protein
MFWMSRAQFPAGQDFSLCHSVRTGYAAHPASPSVAAKDLFTEINRTKRDAVVSTAFSDEFKNQWSYTSSPPYICPVL